MIRFTELELQRLENCFVVLILVLQHHVVYVPIREERIVVVELGSLQPLENCFPYLLQSQLHLRERWQRKTGASCARMLEWIVHPGHFRKFNRAIEILSQPELFEMRNVSQVPQNWAHERIMLSQQIFLSETVDEQERSLARFRELSGNRRSEVRGD